MSNTDRESDKEKLKRHGKALTKDGDLYTEELSIQRLEGDIAWSRGVPLPMQNREAPTYRMHYRSGEAICQWDHKTREWRIPYIVRYFPGDMKALLDELVRQTDRTRLKFVNVSPDGAAAALSEVMGIEDPRNLREALHGFEEITEEWERPSGDGTEEVDCLRGEWLPEEY